MKGSGDGQPWGFYSWGTIMNLVTRREENLITTMCLWSQPIGLQATMDRHNCCPTSLGVLNTWSQVHFIAFLPMCKFDKLQNSTCVIAMFESFMNVILCFFLMVEKVVLMIAFPCPKHQLQEFSKQVWLNSQISSIAFVYGLVH